MREEAVRVGTPCSEAALIRPQGPLPRVFPHFSPPSILSTVIRQVLISDIENFNKYSFNENSFQMMISYIKEKNNYPTNLVILVNRTVLLNQDFFFFSD